MTVRPSSRSRSSRRSSSARGRYAAGAGAMASPSPRLRLRLRVQVEELVTRRAQAAGDGLEQARVDGGGERRVLAQRPTQLAAVERDERVGSSATAVDVDRDGGTRADQPTTSPGSTVMIVTSPRSGTSSRRATLPSATIPNGSVRRPRAGWSHPRRRAAGRRSKPAANGRGATALTRTIRSRARRRQTAVRSLDHGRTNRQFPEGPFGRAMTGRPDRPGDRSGDRHFSRRERPVTNPGALPAADAV